MTKIYTQHHVLQQERRRFCWTIYPKGWPKLASSTETNDIRKAMKQVERLEEDLTLIQKKQKGVKHENNSSL